MGHPRRQPRTLLVTRTATVVLAMLGVLLMWLAFDHPSVSEPALDEAAVEPNGSSGSPATAERKSARAISTSTSGPRSTKAVQDDVRDQINGLVLPESKPLALSIPQLGVRTKLVDLGLDRSGALEVPQDPSLAGWFSRGAAPGALGPAVIAGHVTWNGAPAVFHRLGSLRKGDRLTVYRKDGRAAVFTVTRAARFSKSKFPSRAVYGPVDHAGLRLITCGGTYDAARHRYLDNVVIFAKLKAVHHTHHASGLY
jgi:sortase (surface protein transpeptidase)